MSQSGSNRSSPSSLYSQESKASPKQPGGARGISQSRSMSTSREPLPHCNNESTSVRIEQSSRGQRTGLVLPRGIYSSAGTGASQWLPAIETIIQYHFQDPDLLEEALESPGSGITCVGLSHRHLDDGNRGFSIIGEAAMKLVLKDQCYLFHVSNGDASKFMDKILSRRHLDQIGRKTKIEKYIRPRKPLQPSKRRNILALLKEDVQTEDRSRTVARAMRAIIGAVFYDGGLEAVRKVMGILDLSFKAPDAYRLHYA
ncbi:ribonuclease III domain-containing protein [Xylogone sp. PMI_703]|nr:ribonuclease III domain-containing protein [Xylogone sp. PMI_703]